MAARKKFMTSLGVNYTDLEPGVELPQGGTRRPGSGEAFFAYTNFPIYQFANLPLFQSPPFKTVRKIAKLGLADSRGKLV